MRTLKRFHITVGTAIAVTCSSEAAMALINKNLKDYRLKPDEISSVTQQIAAFMKDANASEDEYYGRFPVGKTAVEISTSFKKYEPAKRYEPAPASRFEHLQTTHF